MKVLLTVFSKSLALGTLRTDICPLVPISKTCKLRRSVLVLVYVETGDFVLYFEYL